MVGSLRKSGDRDRRQYGVRRKMVENLSANGANVVYADLAPNQSFNEMEGITFIKCDVTKRPELKLSHRQS